jgi:DNA invertase Pin-like site-specific DNA recombinase
MKVQYTRVSTIGQKTDRQIVQGLKVYEDKISGSIAFKDRPKVKQLLRDIDNGLVTEIVIHSIDRLGRNTLDILSTIQDLTDKGINVISRKEGFETMHYGSVNPTAKLMISMLATLSEFELDRIKERRLEGIAIAKAKGNYKSNGGKPKETIEQFLSKRNNSKCYNLIKKQGKSLRVASALSGVSYGTAAKISRYINS